MKTLMAVVSAVVLSLVATFGLQPVPHAQAATSVGGTIEIKKIISPSDTTTWNFGIDFNYTFFQTNQTDGYDSGPIAVPAGSHTVLEQTGYGTDGTPYFSTVECKDGVTVVKTHSKMRATVTYGADGAAVLSLDSKYKYKIALASGEVTFEGKID